MQKPVIIVAFPCWPFHKAILIRGGGGGAASSTAAASRPPSFAKFCCPLHRPLLPKSPCPWCGLARILNILCARALLGGGAGAGGWGGAFSEPYPWPAAVCLAPAGWLARATGMALHAAAWQGQQRLLHTLSGVLRYSHSLDTVCLQQLMHARSTYFIGPKIRDADECIYMLPSRSIGALCVCALDC
jgi:hypothetical protein